ncbi:MAG: monovalent cation/H(+) antiporter subunit G [Treponema sp.]|nr:monovalent cation/H(+) antiporter subunit G [Treponema sp.]
MENLHVLIGSVITVIGAVFMFFGIVGIYRFKNFYPRILITSKIDTVGMLTFMIGIAIRHGFSHFSLKVLFITTIMMILNPLLAYIVTRSAYLSAHKIEDSRQSGKEV